jgi:glucan phosphoethanolaminetransferase (alkaline phosphatase superfamily)
MVGNISSLKLTSHKIFFLKFALFFFIAVLLNFWAAKDFIFWLGLKDYGAAIITMIVSLTSLLTMVAVAFNRNLLVRIVWGLFTGVSAGFVTAFGVTNHSSLELFELISLWNSVSGIGAAASFFTFALTIGTAVFLANFCAFILPPDNRFVMVRSWHVNWAAAPLLPISFIAFLFWNFAGTIYFWPPAQYGTLSLTGLMWFSQYTHPIPSRDNVTWKPEFQQQKKNIVLLMDETLRGDYIDLQPDNPFTPKLAKLAGQLVNFGLASSAADCSHYSNSMIRFGVSRKDLRGSADRNPTLFDYAKKAGYRTVYINAQTVSRGVALMNFMTAKEMESIDAYYPVTDVPVFQADEELANYIAKELNGKDPVFIYANMLGSHFPYDWGYPKAEVKFYSKTSELGDSVTARIASYRNAIAWSVDHFMERLFAISNMSNVTLLFTGDHGESFNLSKSPHCQSGDIEPIVGVVPLLVYASDPKLRGAFAAGATKSWGKPSHFMIAPTLYQLMGYSKSDITKNYDENLFDGTTRDSNFLNGDVYNFFGGKTRSIHVDLTASYLESENSMIRIDENAARRFAANLP